MRARAYSGGLNTKTIYWNKIQARTVSVTHCQLIYKNGGRITISPEFHFNLKRNEQLPLCLHFSLERIRKNESSHIFRYVTQQHSLSLHNRKSKCAALRLIQITWDVFIFNQADALPVWVRQRFKWEMSLQLHANGVHLLALKINFVVLIQWQHTF